MEGKEKPATGNGKTKGRQRVEMAAIPGKARRQVTFSKRKAGLLRKASKISWKSGASVSVVAFSGAGKLFALCTGPSAISVDQEVQALYVAADEKAKEVKAEKERLDRIGDKVSEAQKEDGKAFWWQTELEKLGPQELPEFAKGLVRLRENVQRRVDQLYAASAVASTPRLSIA